jgi:hypothetical protein
MGKLPELKTIIDSIGDGAVEVAEAPVRAAENTADTAKSFADHVKANMDDFKKRMPNDLSAIPDCAMRAVGHTVSDGISLFEGLGKALHDTLDGVKNQIKRVTG